jgi:hypothetical protein
MESGVWWRVKWQARGAHWPREGPRLALKASFHFQLQDVSTFSREGGANPKEGVSFKVMCVGVCGHTLKGDVGGLGGAHLMKEGPTT